MKAMEEQRRIYESVTGTRLLDADGMVANFQHNSKKYKWSEIVRRTPRHFQALAEFKHGFSDKVAKRLTEITTTLGPNPGKAFRKFLKSVLENTFDLMPMAD